MNVSGKYLHLKPNNILGINISTQRLQWTSELQVQRQKYIHTPLTSLIICLYRAHLVKLTVVSAHPSNFPLLSAAIRVLLPAPADEGRRGNFTTHMVCTGSVWRDQTTVHTHIFYQSCKLSFGICMYLDCAPECLKNKNKQTKNRQTQGEHTTQKLWPFW